MGGWSVHLSSHTLHLISAVYPVFPLNSSSIFLGEGVSILHAHVCMKVLNAATGVILWVVVANRESSVCTLCVSVYVSVWSPASIKSD